jgi:colicin import membrane protein
MKKMEATRMYNQQTNEPVSDELRDPIRKELDARKAAEEEARVQAVIEHARKESEQRQAAIEAEQRATREREEQQRAQSRREEGERAEAALKQRARAAYPGSDQSFETDWPELRRQLALQNMVEDPGRRGQSKLYRDF